jgi:hypothetical protein
MQIMGRNGERAARPFSPQEIAVTSPEAQKVHVFWKFFRTPIELASTRKWVTKSVGAFLCGKIRGDFGLGFYRQSTGELRVGKSAAKPAATACHELTRDVTCPKLNSPNFGVQNVPREGQIDI